MSTSTESAIGTFHLAGNPRFVRGVFVVWMAAALCIIGFGAIGGPYYFDDPATWPHSPEARVEAVASMRRLLCGAGGAFFLVSALLVFVARRAQAQDAQLRPAGDAARDPFAWMRYVSQLTGGRWIGPAAGRTFAIQTMRRRGPSTLQLSTPVECFTRVSWSRRPPAGRAIDRAAGLATEDGAPHGFPDLDVSMSDAAWAGRLFAEGSVRAAVSTLTRDDELVMIILRPARLLFHLPYGSSSPIDDARLRRYVDALVELASAIEANGRPAERLEPNALERMVDRMLA